MLAIIFDEGNDLIFQVLHRMEIASPNDFPGEGGKPNLDLVKPGCMGRREVKDNRLVRRRQEGQKTEALTNLMTQQLDIFGDLKQKLGELSTVGEQVNQLSTMLRKTQQRGVWGEQILEALLDKVTAFLLKFAEALVENGANAIFLPEPTASASMISPTMFRQFVLPRLKKLTQNLKVPCILHICGDTSPTLKAMGESGAKVLSLDQCMDLSSSRAVVKDGVLGGNVDPINALLMGSKEQVVNDTLNCLRSAGTKRFVLMTGCGVPPNTPLENVKIMIKTAKEYGLGP